MSYYKMDDGRLISVYDLTSSFGDRMAISCQQAVGISSVKRPTENERYTSMMATIFSNKKASPIY